MDNNQVQQNHVATIYPHPAQILKVTAWTSDPKFQSKAVAGVMMRYGPFIVRAKLLQGDRGLFLRMPARKNENTGDYWEHVIITDRTLQEEFESLAIRAYYAEVGEVVTAA